MITGQRSERVTFLPDRTVVRRHLEDSCGAAGKEGLGWCCATMSAVSTIRIWKISGFMRRRASSSGWAVARLRGGVSRHNARTGSRWGSCRRYQGNLGAVSRQAMEIAAGMKMPPVLYPPAKPRWTKIFGGWSWSAASPSDLPGYGPSLNRSCIP